MSMKVLYAVTFVLLCSCGYAQEQLSPYSVGVFGGYLLNNHSADFKKIPECPSCSPGFESGTGNGLAAGALFEYRLFPFMSFGARVGYYGISAALEKIEPTTFIIEGQETPGEFKHTLDATFSTISFQPTIKLTAFNSLNLNLGVSLSSLLSKDYKQQEQIWKPDGVGTYVDPTNKDTLSRIRNKFSGSFENAAPMLFALNGGISYTLPMNKERSLTLEPEISYSLGMTNLLDHPDTKKWKANYLQIGAAIRYTFPVEKEILKQRRRIERFDTVTVENELISESYIAPGRENSRDDIEMIENVEVTTTTVSRIDTLFRPKVFALKADIYAVGVDADGKEIPNPKIIIEEFTSNKMKPLLNYIFFEDNSAEIPSRYKSLSKNEAERFQLNDLYSYETIDVYHYILNIIGRRMKDNPSAKITVVGCTSDNGSEKGNPALATNRANAIKNYLTGVWGVEASRIIDKKRNLPEKASTPLDDPEKMQENRRVEIYSDNYDILSPVYLADTARAANPPIIRFYPQVSCEAGIKSWAIAASQAHNGDRSSFAKTGSEAPPKSIDWEVASVSSLTPKYAQPLNYHIGAEDSRGKRVASANKELPFELVTISRKRESGVKDKTIDSYSLILFDFDKSDIIGTNKKIIDFLKKRITPESIITIEGYSDRTGEDEYNKVLSEKRANSVKNAIDRKDAKIKNIGEDKLLYDNDIPEGRFYCRTVDIKIETPVEQTQGSK
ncbi:MAG: OmpA family protein [Chloroflexota bacterium]